MTDPVAHCKGALFPSTPWILDQCRAIEKEQYDKLFAHTAETPPEDLLSGDVMLFKKYANYYYNIVRV